MLEEIHDIIYYRSEILDECDDIMHAFLGRKGGISGGHLSSLNLGRSDEDRPEHIHENRRRVANAFGTKPDRFFTVTQIHSDKVVVLDEACLPEDFKKMEGDAIITSMSGIAIGVLTADCVPIILCDGTKKVTAAIHAGWKGSRAAICLNTIHVMSQRFGSRPEDIYAAIGPSIGQCCYEVDEPVVKEFSDISGFAEETERGWMLDLPGINFRQLKEAGVQKIDLSDICTSCNRDLFFSHRGDKGKTGRQFSFIIMHKNY